MSPVRNGLGLKILENYSSKPWKKTIENEQYDRKQYNGMAK